MKKRGGRKERRKFAREESRGEWRDWKGADRDIKRLKRRRERERGKWLDNIDEAVKPERERSQVEFELKIKRDTTRCISWINDNIQAKGGSMFVDVDESLKRGREREGKKYLLEIRRQTRKHKYDYTRIRGCSKWSKR